MLLTLFVQTFDSLGDIACRVAELQPAAFAQYTSKSSGIQFVGKDGQIVGGLSTDQWIDEVKVSPDGSMALALWREQSTKTGLTTGRLVVASKDRVLAKTEIHDAESIYPVRWYGKDILVKTGSRILKWHSDGPGKEWSMAPFDKSEGTILSEGRRIWKTKGNQLIERIEGIDLNSMTVGKEETACLIKIENSPFLLRGVAPDQGEKITRAVYYLDNLQSGKESMLIEGAFGDSAMYLSKTKSLLYYKWTSTLHGQLVMRKFPYGSETLIGSEARIPAAIKLGDDAVLIGDQVPFRDHLYIFHPSTMEMKLLDGLGLAAIHIGSCR